MISKFSEPLSECVNGLAATYESRKKSLDSLYVSENTRGAGRVCVCVERKRPAVVDLIDT